MEQGDYSVHLDPGAYGSDATLQINHSYDADPEIAKWLQNADFRRALSMGIDRDQLNETFWLGVGSPGSVAPDERAAEPRRRVAHQVGHPRRRAGQPAPRRDRPDREGWRGFAADDGSGRLRLEVFAISGAFVPFPASPSRSPSSGRRSASSSTSRSWSATWA